MAQQTFDDFLFAIQSSMVDAQDAIATRVEGAGTAVGDAHGAKTGAELFDAVVPSSDGGGDGVEVFSLSNSFFCGRRRHRISLLSLEFECFLQNKSRSDGAWKYLMTIKKGNAPPGNEVHRMHIVFGGLDDFAGVVGLNGQIFMEVPVFRARNFPHKTNEKKEPFFLKIFNGFKAKHREEEGFIMTEKQTALARKITECPDRAVKERDDQ